MGRLDKGVGNDLILASGQADVFHPAHLDPAIQDRRAFADAVGILHRQRHLGAGCILADQGRAILAHETILGRGHVCVPVSLDKGSGQDRVQARDPLGRDLRADNPERGVGVDIRGDVLVHPNLDHHAGQIRGKAYGFDLTHGDFTKAQGRFAGRHAGGVGKFDLDHGAPVGISVPGNAQRHHQGNDRNQPDHVDPGLGGARGRLAHRACRSQGRRRVGHRDVSPAPRSPSGFAAASRARSVLDQSFARKAW